MNIFRPLYRYAREVSCRKWSWYASCRKLECDEKLKTSWRSCFGKTLGIGSALWKCGKVIFDEEIYCWFGIVSKSSGNSASFALNLKLKCIFISFSTQSQSQSHSELFFNCLSYFFIFILSSTFFNYIFLFCFFFHFFFLCLLWPSHIFQFISVLFCFINFIFLFSFFVILFILS